jgi:hypothetical protein
MNELSPRQDTLSADYFRARTEEANQFADQNDRYATTNSDPAFDSLEEFRDIARGGLYEEQLDTRATLLQHDNDSYAQLSDAIEQKQTELAAANARLDTLTDEEDAQKTRVLAAAKRAIELAPYAETAADTLASQKIDAIEHLNRDSLRARIAAISFQLANLEQADLVASEPWPVPLVLRDNALAQFSEHVSDTYDEIPLGPESHETSSDTMRKLVERHGYTHGASLRLTEYFMQHDNVVLTPEQLGDYLYTDQSHFEGMTEQEKNRCIRMRIHSLLNQHAFVGDWLATEGYLLQYGYRHFVDAASSKDVRPKRRIYRVVQMNDQPDAPHTFTEHVDAANPAYAVALAETESNPLSLAAEENNDAHIEFIQSVQSAIVKLDNYGLLPKQYSKHVAAGDLRGRILRIPKDERRSLQSLLNGITTVTPNYATSATEIVMSTLDRQHQPHHKSRRAYDRVYGQVEVMLTDFYAEQTDAS